MFQFVTLWKFATNQSQKRHQWNRMFIINISLKYDLNRSIWKIPSTENASISRVVVLVSKIKSAKHKIVLIFFFIKKNKNCIFLKCFFFDLLNRFTNDPLQPRTSRSRRWAATRTSSCRSRKERGTARWQRRRWTPPHHEPTPLLQFTLYRKEQTTLEKTWRKPQLLTW